VNTNTEYQVIFVGVKANHSVATVTTRLAKQLNVTPERISQLLARAPILIKTTQDHTQARRYQAMLQQVGAVCRIHSQPALTTVQSDQTAPVPGNRSTPRSEPTAAIEHIATHLLQEYQIHHTPKWYRDPTFRWPLWVALTLMVLILPLALLVPLAILGH
jgi:hypothetical protein